MGKSLVIVESPAKAKTINKYLGAGFVVKSSVGHIRDLPVSGIKKVDPKARAKEAAKTRKMTAEAKAAYKKEKARKQLVARMGIDPDDNWKADYRILPRKEEVVSELQRLAKDAPEIYLATDLDREGEAIAWHLREAIGGDESRYRRVVFNEITKKAVEEAFKNPGVLNMDRVNAQQARRFLDRVVGFKLSPLLWSKVARGLSAGRVQSVAVKVIVERENEIRAFVPEEFWELEADLSSLQMPAPEEAGLTTFQVTKFEKKSFRPSSKDEVDAAIELLIPAEYRVSSRNEKPTKTRPSAPYITSTLQQASSTRLGFGVKKTMMLAQRLYEAGYITYMRTDSTNLSSDAVRIAREVIKKTYGKSYLPEEPRLYSSKSGAQEAHEAIRPSDATVKATSLQGVDRDAERLYELIWRQFLACQMTDAEYLSTTLLIEAGDFELKVRGRIVKFDGHTRAQSPLGKKEGDVSLPDLKVGEMLKLIELHPSQHFTKPPPRYGEASLVKELEKKGIGRPSTYASIITTIQDRGYVTLTNKRFYAEKIGDVVTERLSESFRELLDYNFTAQLEEGLDKVSSGNVDWRSLLNKFYGEFETRLQKAQSPQGMRLNEPSTTDIICEICGREMQIRIAGTGVFLGCSGYALPPKERCKNTINLLAGDEAVSTNDEEDESRILINKRRCTDCETAMDSYLVDESRKLHVCGKNPDCTSFQIEKGEFKIKGYDGPVLECHKCGSEMQLKTGPFGKYFGCVGEDCKNTRKILRNGEPYPVMMDPIQMPNLQCEKNEDDCFVLREGLRGLFLAASKFPKNRETRKVKKVELMPFQNELPEYFQYLLTGPDADNLGREVFVKYRAKRGESYDPKNHYLMTEDEKGKPTRWEARLVGREWDISGN